MAFSNEREGWARRPWRKSCLGWVAGDMLSRWEVRDREGRRKEGALSFAFEWRVEEAKREPNDGIEWLTLFKWNADEQKGSTLR